jgi:hypothetical protein
MRVASHNLSSSSSLQLWWAKVPERLEPLHIYLCKMVELCLKLIPRFFGIDFQVQIGGLGGALY